MTLGSARKPEVELCIPILSAIFPYYAESIGHCVERLLFLTLLQPLFTTYLILSLPYLPLT